VTGEQDDLPPHAELALGSSDEACPELGRERFVHICIRWRVTP